MGAGYVAAVSVDLHLPTSGSLKDKRREVKRVTHGLARRFGAAAAEVDHHELRQRARVTAALVGSDSADLGARVEAVSRWLHADEVFEVVGESREIIRVDDDHGWGDDG
ncbi:MAG: DUF503 domain-containing protein [Thermoleophilia bacterium]|nr:DUF503 domain-containing protein [Thermoleophilia bacterium]